MQHDAKLENVKMSETGSSAAPSNVSKSTVHECNKFH